MTTLRRQCGYVLIYALTVLLFLVGTVTGAAYALRLNAQEAYQQRERLRAEFRLRGALHYALAQFALAATARAAPAASPAAGQSEKPARPGPGWPLEPSTQKLQIDAVDVAVAIEDPGGIADANALDERMWTDYFAALAPGMAQPGEAQRWAAALIAWKTRVGKANGRGGFAAIDDLLVLDALPATVRYGGWAAADRPRTPAGPGLPDLFLVGGGERVFDINRAALPLLAAATGAGSEQLTAYRAARERRKLTLDEAVRLLGERARPLLQVSRTDAIARLVLTTAMDAGAAGAGRLSLVAFVQRREGEVRVLGSRLNPVAAEDVEQ